MTTSKASSHFQSKGEDYARYRPTYPPELASYLAGLCSDHQFALEVGCGTGQFTKLLAQHFQNTLATDVSASQISNAAALPNVEFKVEAAEAVSALDQSANLIVAAQAVHWFDLPKFYQQVQRIAAPDCILALISYGVLSVEGESADKCFQEFYKNTIGPFWPPERAHVERYYRTLEFPFVEVETPSLTIICHWTLPQFLGYVATWSAVKAAQKQGQGGLLEKFREQLTKQWGDPLQQRQIVFPIAMRVARL